MLVYGSVFSMVEKDPFGVCNDCYVTLRQCSVNSEAISLLLLCTQCYMLATSAGLCKRLVTLRLILCMLSWLGQVLDEIFDFSRSYDSIITFLKVWKSS